MADPLVVHIEPATPPAATPRLHIAFHGSLALTGAVINPYTVAAQVLQAQGEDPLRLLIKRRRGTDLNEWRYTIAQAAALGLENEQPEVPPVPPTGYRSW